MFILSHFNLYKISLYNCLNYFKDVAVETELIKWKQTKVKMVYDVEKEITNSRYTTINEYKLKYEAQTNGILILYLPLVR